jgi:hypothetical protein
MKVYIAGRLHFGLGAELATQRVANWTAFCGWKGQVELAAILEARLAVPSPKLLRETLREIGYEIRRVFRAYVAILLFFHDEPPDVPVRLHHRGVQDTIRTRARYSYDSSDFLIERGTQF